MEYEIKIEKREVNPNYKPNCYGYSHPGDENNHFNTIKILDTILTEKEFAAVKKACLEVM